MKLLFSLALVMCLYAVARSENHCQSTVTRACQGIEGTVKVPSCDARYGGIAGVENHLKHYIHLQLAKSYEYLLLATHFNSYEKNRPGFRKLFQSLSDRSFDDSIDLIKQLNRRGGNVDVFELNHELTHALNSKKVGVLEVNELVALSIALDSEKALSKDAIHIHNNASTESYDPEIAHYIEEKFLPRQAESIRKLSGYANDLAKMMDNEDPSLSVYLFDEYLQKQ